MFDLTGKKALVTGGGRGIGWHVAVALKQAGAEVIISGSNEERLRAVALSLDVHYVVADLAAPAGASQLAGQVADIDILVNNAGITRDNLFQRMKDDDWDSVLQVNLRAAIDLSRALVPGMLKKRFGRVINMASVVAHMGNIGQTNYITAKAGLTGFTKALSGEVARRGVTVNCIAPGFITSDMTDRLDDKTKENYLVNIPAKRFGEPAEIAAAVVYLASPEAGYTTGTTLHINGGMYLG